MRPKVSVGIPTYNRREDVLRAIASVQAQTYEELEICVLDDGSTDGTGEAVRAIKDDRIVFRRWEENRGLGCARNELMGMSSCDFTAFHDSDDLSHPQRIKFQMEVLLEQEAMWCATTRVNIAMGETPEWQVYEGCPPLAKTRKNAVTPSILMRSHYMTPREEGKATEHDLPWLRRTWRQFGRKLLVLEAPLYAVRYGALNGIGRRRKGPDSPYGKLIEGPMPI